MNIYCFYFDHPALCISYEIFKEQSGRYTFNKNLIYSNTGISEEQPYYKNDKTFKDSLIRVIGQLRVIEILYKIAYKRSNWDWETMKLFRKYWDSLNGLPKHYDQLIEDLVMLEMSGKDIALMANVFKEAKYHPPTNYYEQWIKENYNTDSLTIVNFDLIVTGEFQDFLSTLEEKANK